MSPTMWLTLQAIIVLVGPVLWGWYVCSRTGASWRVWGWGALTFFISQIVLRIPLLQLATVGMAQLDLGWTEQQSFLFNLVFLTLTASLFEEGGRWLMMRWRNREIRGWRDGVMFGAGHGGIEAMILVGAAAINGLVLLSSPETIIAQVQAQAPEQLPLLETQIEQLQSLSGGAVGLAIWERVLAILFHTAASLLVLKSVVEGKKVWWWAAFVLHTLLNGIALVVVQYGGVVQSEIALTLFSVVSAAVIWWTYRQRERAPAQPIDINERML